MTIKDDKRLNEEEQLFGNTNPDTPRCHPILSRLHPLSQVSDRDHTTQDLSGIGTVNNT
jgi:hypothetical protein